VETASHNTDSGPYLSIVVTARNDDHGGNLLGRMQTFVNALLAQAKRHAVPLELVVVDWNPPPDKPPLFEALRWPDDPGPVEIRCIEVPPALHHTFAHGAALPLYQMIAKNVGIRRARGQFILATNIDVIFSHELFAFFAQRRLEPGCMYRIDRHDAMQDVPVDASIDEQLRYCETHLIRVNTRQGTFPVNPAGQRVLEPDDIVPGDSGISLGRGWYPLEGSSPESHGYRWVLNDAEIFVGTHPAEECLVLDLEPGPGVAFLPFLLRVIGPDGEILQESAVSRRQLVRIKLPPVSQPYMLRLRVPAGGLEGPRDPRILNFRVVSMYWDRTGTAPARSAASRPKTTEPARTSFPVRLWRFIRQLRSAGGPTQVGLPLPLFLVRRLNPQVQGSDLVFTFDPGWVRLRGRARKPSAPPRDIVPQGLNLLWGRGWYPQENYKGESFRWARNGAELILHTPPAQPASLRLQIEPGPALGYRPFHLRLRDDSGNTIATATVIRRQWIELPMPWRPDQTQVFTLHARGDSPPRALPNDPRSLAFRVLQCCWAAGEAAPLANGVHPAAAQQPWTPIFQAPGVLLGHGWLSEVRRHGPTAWRGEPGAEIIVRPYSQPSGLLVLEVEPLDGSPIELQVREGRKVVASKTLDRRERIRLPLHLQEQQTGVLRLTAMQPGSTSSGSPAEPATRPLRLVHASWDDGRGFRERPSLTPPQAPTTGRPAEPAACGPAFLHTNACGDFTLLAREHWFDLRGYPEFDLFSMNLDSVFCYAAHHGGAPETFLADPMRVYHIEHATGSGFTPEGQAQLFQRIAAKGLSWLDYEQVMDWAAQMRRLERPMIFNADNWGFAGIPLAERTLSSPAPAPRHSSQGV
jgi:hypothetical protein